MDVKNKYYNRKKQNKMRYQKFFFINNIILKY